VDVVVVMDLDVVVDADVVAVVHLDAARASPQDHVTVQTRYMGDEIARHIGDVLVEPGAARPEPPSA